MNYWFALILFVLAIGTVDRLEVRIEKLEQELSDQKTRCNNLEGRIYHLEHLVRKQDQ